jgi:hypothetical protein
MKHLITIILITITIQVIGQDNTGLATLDFVRIAEGRRAEALYFYQNNWLTFRKTAYEMGWIDHYQLLEVPENKEYQLILITTYKNDLQYQGIESHFSSWRKSNPVRLLNDLEPEAFRKNVKAIATTVLDKPAKAEVLVSDNCSAEQNRAFDFWLGEWEVTNPEGKLAGHNSIRRIQAGCGLQENWISATGNFQGTSYNFFDKATGKWYQSWIDNQGGVLQLTGGLQEANMVLTSQPLRNKDGQLQIDRITWVPRVNGTVEQIWEKTTDAGRNWQKVFHGIYTRK